ncbi:MAG: methionyl-tRNA formyltransferase [Candidatus Aminicenantales bacterium]
MKIVFFGSPATALPSLKKILEANHNLALIITQPDKPSGRGKKLTPPPVKKFAMDHKIPCYQPPKIRKDPEAAKIIQKINPELIVVVAYGQLIPSSIIYLPYYGSINVHFSLLPKYRGASPVSWALLNGEKKTGITIFKLNEKMDEGDILSQKEVSIFPQERAGELERRLAEIGANLLLETISKIDKIKPIPQNHSQATYAPRLKKEDGRINWTKNSLQIERQVRAFYPWPSAFTFLRGQRLKIIKGRAFQSKIDLNVSPGEIFSINKEGLGISCGQKTAYLVEELQPENKKPMTAYAFSLGAKLKLGDCFS